MPEPGVGMKSDSISSGGSKSAGGAKSGGGGKSGDGGKAASDKDKPGFLDGIKSFGSALAAAPGAIARDLSMGATALKGGFSFEGQKAALEKAGYTPQQAQDYIDRTKATIARNEAEAIAAQRDKPDRPFDAAPTSPAMPVAPEEQMPVYRSPFGTAPPIGTTMAPPGPEITPQMRAAALQMFESQRGAGQIPYQMLPYQQGIGSMRPGISPAFQYAAQNYQRLGGSQRLMDRPMEMMSAAERQRINEMSRAMAERQEYDMGRRMMGKGGGAVEPRRPLPRGFGDDVAPGMAGRSFGIASLRGLPSYLVR